MSVVVSDDPVVGHGGSHVSPTRPGAPRQAPRWQQATVEEVIEEAPDAVTLRLRLEEQHGFEAGQYYNVRLTVPGHERPVQRAYSVGSSPLPDPSVIDLGVRAVPGGAISPRLVGSLAPGQQVTVRGPYGRFTWTGSEHLSTLLVGAGSGLVPLMSMVRFAARSGRTEPVWLVCSAITYDHAFYRHELSHLAATQPWLRVVHCITRDPADPRADFHRRIDRGVIDAALDGAVPNRCFLCGPPAMVDTVGTTLMEMGVDPDAIRAERYD